MIRSPLLYPFYAETHLRRGRTVLRPVVPVAIGDEHLVVDALVDTGSEHVLADASLALATGISLDDPVDVEEIGLGGGIVRANFVQVTAWLHPPAGHHHAPVNWELDVGFIRDWRPLYPMILGSVGFLHEFTVTLSRHAHATAVEHRDEFHRRFGTQPGM